MQLLEQDRKIIRFGDFLLDVGERRLARGDEPIQLMPKVFDLLAALATNHGRLLTKTELMDLVWPDVAVEESNLTNNIAILRKTLGPDADGKSFIETVTRHGYRFNGVKPPEPSFLASGSLTIERHSITRIVTEEIEPLEESITVHPIPSTPLLPAATETGRAPRRRWASLGLVAGLVVIAGFGGWLAARKAGQPVGSLQPVRLATFTSEPGQEMRPAFSPDGNRLAFIWDGPGGDNFDIYLKDVGKGAMRRLTTDPAFDTSPVWSPDGRTIAFLRKLADGFAVVLIPADGGPERTIATATDGLSWSPDGKYLTISDRPRPDAPARVHLLSVETGQKKAIAADFDAPGEDARSALSPDGREIAFVRHFAEVGELFVVPVGGGKPKQLTFDRSRFDSFAWTPDSRELIFSSGRNGDYTPWRIPRDGGAPLPIPSLSGNCRDVAVAPRGNRMAYRRVQGDLDIWRLDLATREPFKVAASTQMDDSPQISPDGNRLAFMSVRTGHLEIWLSGAKGESPTQLTHSEGPQVGSPRWSPDGRRLAYDGHHEGDADIFIVNADGGAPVRLTEGKHRNVLPSWSNDGKWIYFCSNRSGTHQIWKVPSTGGTPTQLTREGGWESFEATDGKSLFFTKGREIPGIWNLSLETGAETLVTILSKAGRNRAWYPARTGLYFIALTPPDGWTLNKYDFASKTVVRVAPIAKAPAAGPGNIAVSRDEDAVFYVQAESTGSDIILVENFGVR
jgi:Tol biopolymer transport system component/DNA-binding winged helix-turn-helix (wHTH) protein